MFVETKWSDGEDILEILLQTFIPGGSLSRERERTHAPVSPYGATVSLVGMFPQASQPKQCNSMLKLVIVLNYTLLITPFQDFVDYRTKRKL